jgi:phage tail protein X
MDAVSSRITSELEEQRADLVDLLDRRMADMKATLREAILEAAEGLEDGSEPPAPAG